MTSLLLILLAAPGSGQIQMDSSGTVVSVESNLTDAECNRLVGRLVTTSVQPWFPVCANAAELTHQLTRLECVIAPNMQQPRPAILTSEEGTLRLNLVRYTCKKDHL